MSHLARGLWGYVGQTPDGRGLTVQSTGAGGPAVAAVLSDLAEAGVETALRMGTCESKSGGPAAGGIVLVTEAIALDGAGNNLTEQSGTGPRVRPDAELTARLESALDDRVAPGPVSSHDLVARLDRDVDEDGPAAIGRTAPVRDLQTAAFLAIAERVGVRAAAILIVVEDSEGNRLGESEIEAGLSSLWPAIASALGKH